MSLRGQAAHDASTRQRYALPNTSEKQYKYLRVIAYAGEGHKRLGDKAWQSRTIFRVAFDHPGEA